MATPNDLESLRRELLDPLPHPDSAEWPELLDPVIDWLRTDWETLADGPVGRHASRAELDALLREPPPDQGLPFADVFRAFQIKIVPFNYRINHPRFFAFVPGSPTLVAVLGEFLCAGTNFFSGLWMEGSGPAEVELIVIDWFKTFVDYPAEAEGLLTGGGSEATLTALIVAREVLSYAERERAVIYVTEQRHWSVDKAAKVIGLRPDQVRALPPDERFRFQPPHLAATIAADRAVGLRPWMVVANTGATNTGAVDPLADLVSICRRERLWLHVDAAYGWTGVLVPEEKPAFAGLEAADSITLDPHKWFAQPFEAGCLLVREPGRLAETFASRPDYLQETEPAADEVNFADRGLALTRRFRALKIWLSIKVLGVGWFRELAARGCRLAAFAEALVRQSPDLEILSARQLSIVCFRCRPQERPIPEQGLDRLNRDVAVALRETGRGFVSTTKLHGRIALRVCFVNWRTTAADVEEVIGLLRTLAAKLVAERAYT